MYVYKVNGLIQEDIGEESLNIIACLCFLFLFSVLFLFFWFVNVGKKHLVEYSVCYFCFDKNLCMKQNRGSLRIKNHNFRVLLRSWYILKEGARFFKVVYICEPSKFEKISVARLGSVTAWDNMWTYVVNIWTPWWKKVNKIGPIQNTALWVWRL